MNSQGGAIVTEHEKIQLSAEVLRMRDENMWGSHEGWPVEDWQREVAEDNTRLGYWEWVEANVDLYGDYLEEEETEEEAEE